MSPTKRQTTQTHYRLKHAKDRNITRADLDWLDAELGRLCDELAPKGYQLRCEPTSKPYHLKQVVTALILKRPSRMSPELQRYALQFASEAVTERATDSIRKAFLYHPPESHQRPWGTLE